eukprot:scaffold92819_cov22-Tisochrysis_lutea.AAC.3
MNTLTRYWWLCAIEAGSAWLFLCPGCCSAPAHRANIGGSAQLRQAEAFLCPGRSSTHTLLAGGLGKRLLPCQNVAKSLINQDLGQVPNHTSIDDRA